MKKRIQKIIAMMVFTSLLLSMCAFGAEEDTLADNTLSETALAEIRLFDSIDYSDGNLITEEQFYTILKKALALHGLELTRYPGNNGYFYFNYNNLEGVRLLTISRTEEELEADTSQAWDDYYKEVEKYAAKQQAAKKGTTYEEETEDSTDEDAAVQEKKSANTFDPDKDVENSQDYVISFVMAAGDSEVEEQVMFLVSAIVWCILDPHFNNTDDAFQYLWWALYVNYANSNGQSASTIDGIDTEKPFTIPGNAAEALLGTDDAGNYILGITNYAEYEEIIDINTISGSNFLTSLFSMN